MDFVALSSNFRTTPKLVRELNESFTQIFAVHDGSGIEFSSAEAARDGEPDREPLLNLHVDFIPQTVRAQTSDHDAMRRKQEAADRRVAAHEKQTAEIVALIRSLTAASKPHAPVVKNFESPFWAGRTQL